MQKRPIPTWVMIVLGAIGLLLMIPGLWVFVSVTAAPLYPNAASVPSVMHAPPLPEWVTAVDRARQAVRTSVAEQNLPGLSVAVGMGSEIAWAEGFGFADLKTSEVVTPKSRFRMGTASTVLASAAAGLLLENGRLKADGEIQTYLPAFPGKQWPVTLRQLMGHTAGLVDDGGDRGPLFTRHCEGTLDALPHFVSGPLQFQPGTQFRYSSNGWIVVSAAIEAASDQPFLTYLRQQIFDPLGMRDTTADPSALDADEDFPVANLIRELIYDPQAKRGASAGSQKTPEGRVTPYFTRFASDPKYGVHVMRPLDYSCYAGAGVFISTPSDLVRFGMALRSGKLLLPATVEMLHASQRLASGVETEYGLGWRRRTVTLAGRQTLVIGHDGESLGGMVASFMMVPEHGVVVATMSNVAHADTFSVAVQIADAFLRQGESPRV